MSLDPHLPPPLPTAPPPGRRGPSALLIGALGLVGLLVLAAVLGFGALAARRYLPQLKTPAERQRQREALKEVERVQRENLAEQRRQFDAGDPTTGASERLNRAGGALGDAAKQVSGDERKILEAGQRLAAGLGPKLRAYESASTDLKNAGFFAPNTLTSREAIATRREILKRWMAANEDLAASYQTMSATLRADLQNTGLTAPRLDQEVGRFESTAHLPEQLQLREYDRQIGRTADEMLDFLSREWGHWKIENGDQVMFTRANLLPRFQKYAQALGAADEAQTRLQRQLLIKAAPPPRPLVSPSVKPGR